MHTVGAAAKAVGVSPKAVRIWKPKAYYRRPHAPKPLPPIQRRRYRDSAVHSSCQTLGLTLAEIKDILDLHRQGTAPCDQVTVLLDQHIRDIDRAIADLRALRASLAAALKAARSRTTPRRTATVCALLKAPTTQPLSSTRICAGQRLEIFRN